MTRLPQIERERIPQKCFDNTRNQKIRMVEAIDNFKRSGDCHNSSITNVSINDFPILFVGDGCIFAHICDLTSWL